MLTAPYNFVPLSSTVVLRDRGERVSIELPFPHALCGSFDLVIEAVTPLMVGGTAEPPPQGVNAPTLKHTFTLFGPPALPGTTLKGALRAVIEIATFGKIGRRIDDRRFAVRDLQNPYLYTARFNDMFRPLSRAGWLTVDSATGQWQLRPCDYSLVKQTDLEALYAAARAGSTLRLGKARLTAEDKYGSWAGVPLTVPFNPDAWRARDDWAPGRIVSRADDVGHGRTVGTIVFTGQPSDRGSRNGKAVEFIFHSPRTNPVSVPPAVREDFEHVHRNPNTRAPLPEWAFHRAHLLAGGSVPAFWLADGKSGDQIAAMGLAMMFRLAYNRTTRQLAGTASPDHLSEDPDFAETMFGYVREARSNDANQALAGRVHIECAAIEHAVPNAKTREEILLSPKPAFYPAYVGQRHIEQRSDPPQVKEGSYLAGGKPRPFKAYTTFMERDAVLRGWKRYPVSDQSRPPPVPTPNQPVVKSREVFTRFTPLGAGTRFRATVHVHNLRREELGALLWAISFGDPAQGYCHSLGMGRALGLGCVRIKVDPDSVDLDDVDDAQPWQGRDAGTRLDSCRRAFEDYMNGKVSDWARTLQICMLQAMADPTLGSRKVATHELAQMGGPAPFQEAKQHGHILAPYIADPRAWPAQTQPPSVVASAGSGGPSNPRREADHAQPSVRFGRLADGERVKVLTQLGSEFRVQLSDGSIEFLPLGEVTLE